MANNYWAALKGRNALKVEWTQTSAARNYSSDEVLAQYKSKAMSSDPGVEHGRKGSPAAVLGSAHKVLRAVYTAQHVAHACMEPVNATARVLGDKVEIWAPTQSPSLALGVAAQAVFKIENTSLHTTLLGGGFGRKFETDFVRDAILVAAVVPGTAVKVLWTREDDLRHDKHRWHTT